MKTKIRLKETSFVGIEVSALEAERLSIPSYAVDPPASEAEKLLASEVLTNQLRRRAISQSATIRKGIQKRSVERERYLSSPKNQRKA